MAKTNRAGQSRPLCRLCRAAAEGFNIVYLPPIFHRCDQSQVDATIVDRSPNDPGSRSVSVPELGGHDTVDPLLGTMDDLPCSCERAWALRR